MASLLTFTLLGVPQDNAVTELSKALRLPWNKRAQEVLSQAARPPLPCKLATVF